MLLDAEGGSAAAMHPSLREAYNAGCSLACLRLLQALPLARLPSSSDSSSGGQLVGLLLHGVRHMLRLLPVEDLYGLLQVTADCQGGVGGTRMRACCVVSG